MWPGEKGTDQTGPEGGHSRQAIVIPFYPGILQMLAVFFFERFPLMVGALIPNLIRHHLLVTQGVGKSPILLSPASELRERVAILFHPLTC